MTETYTLEHLLSRLANPGGKGLSITGLTLPVKALLVWALAGRMGRPVMVVEDKEAQAEEFCEALGFFLPPGGPRRVLRFPAWETLPYDELSPHPFTSGSRLETLNALANGERDFILVTSAEALMRKTISPAVVQKATVIVKRGAPLDLEKLIPTLLQTGYQRVDAAGEPGEFSIRGGIVDIYPGAAPSPLRIVLDGDEVESIRGYDPATQKSIGAPLGAAVIPPLREVFYSSGQDPADAFAAGMEESGGEGEARKIYGLLRDRTFFPGMESLAPFFFGGLEPFLSLAPPDTALILDEEGSVFAHMREFESLITEEFAQAAVSPGGAAFLEPDRLFTGREALEKELKERAVALLQELAMEEDGEGSASIRTTAPAKYRGDVKTFFNDLGNMIADGYTVILAAATHGGAERLDDFLKERNLGAGAVKPGEREELFHSLMARGAAPSGGRLFIVENPSPEGFIIPSGKWAVITEDEIFGKTRKAKRRSTPAGRAFRATLADLMPGDLVTHKVHGVGRYLGSKQMAVAGREDEYLEIEYAENQRLFLPIHGSGDLDRYMGAGGAGAPPLDRMGGATWKKTKGRIRKSLMEMAGELLRARAARELAQGCAFSPDGQFHREFADTFEFSETEDQLAAIEDVTADMEKPRPMDRLVCGDVGYGKTEVALRAAFKAAYDGKQVAVLAPTTLLAQQHFQTFSGRFKAFPLKVEMVSRFRTKKEQTQILKRVAEGDLDVLIGTHRLLGPDVKFKNLGLVIVDEEQRFGVRHKEKLMTMKTGVDVLTLTATPIPRTLHTSMLGVKDLSVIQTPPPDRQAIRTGAIKFSAKGIRDALMRELDRGGQAFFVHNKVRSIHAMERFLKKTVPEARYAVAHGQMNEAALEQVMLDFMDRKTDVLICSTIIESGLDIPSANTIVINRADQFGLAQLYQLRGRVGRDRLRAYCYFVVPPAAKLRAAARKRLKAIEELTGLGGGFRLAARDMEIRGAGNLLGSEQSGHIDAIGYEAYRQMVEDAVRELKGEPPREDFEVDLSLGFFGRIPPEYVAGAPQRMELYGRINAAADHQALAQVEEELRDRFGPPPEDTRRLLAFARIKALCRALKIEKVDIIRDKMYLKFNQATALDPAALVTAVFKKGGSLRFISEHTVEAKVEGPTWKERADNMAGFLTFLIQGASAPIKRPSGSRKGG